MKSSTRERVITAFLSTQANGPQLVAWQTLVELTGVSLKTCRRIIAEADGHEFLLARDDAAGVMVAQSADDAETLTARMERDVARLQEIAQTKPLEGGELPPNS
jgi:hypothetical protein